MKIIIEKIPAVKIGVELPSEVSEYASAFLAIFNNVRESSELFKVENSAKTDNVYVTVDAEVEDEAVKWLERFGEIKSRRHITAFRPIIFEYRDAEEDEIFDGEYLELSLF